MMIMMAIVACRSGGDKKDGGDRIVVTGNCDGDGGDNGNDDGDGESNDKEDGDGNDLAVVVLFVMMTTLCW